LKLHTALTGI